MRKSVNIDTKKRVRGEITPKMWWLVREEEKKPKIMMETFFTSLGRRDIRILSASQLQSQECEVAEF